jgi:CRP-like cAMP-binding protein
MKKGTAVPLERMEITGGMTPEEIEALRSRLIPESYGKGSAIFPEGDTARDLFMLSDGLVSIKLKLPQSTRLKRVATYTPGGIFGEVALLDGRPRSASVWAEEDCQIYRLPLDAFESLNRDMPGVAIKLMTNIAKVLSRRLRTTSNEVKVLEES